MKGFINDQFLLQSKTARRLYHDYAEHLPIIDFHNHLAPKDIAEDRIFGNISSLWLEGDHYKWRAMRACGVREEYITGAADDWEKFEQWAHTVPKIIRSPLYHWTHLELKRYFGIDESLNPSTAREIYEQCNRQAEKPAFSVRNLLRKMKVEYLCSMEDPADHLIWHKEMKKDFEVTVSAAFRPDKMLDILHPVRFQAYLKQLEEAGDAEISDYDQLCQVLESRHNYFHDFGCRQGDIALDWFVFAETTREEADRIFKKARSGQPVSRAEADAFRTAMLSFVCGLNAEKNWVQQFHLGALRSINTRGTREIGEACGFDAVNDVPYVAELGKFLDSLECGGRLAKSIFFNLNPRDNAALITLIHSFNDGSFSGKMQYGPAWWFLDQQEGITQHLNDLSSFGVLGNFIGMLTDSRSFLSFTRHEYFRRILCNVLGADVEKGLIPADDEILKHTVENICYYNAKNYLGI
jgi:glucuronate isomerase